MGKYLLKVKNKSKLFCFDFERVLSIEQEIKAKLTSNKLSKTDTRINKDYRKMQCETCLKYEVKGPDLCLCHVSLLLFFNKFERLLYFLFLIFTLNMSYPLGLEFHMSIFIHFSKTFIYFSLTAFNGTLHIILQVLDWVCLIGRLDCIWFYLPKDQFYLWVFKTHFWVLTKVIKLSTG